MRAYIETNWSENERREHSNNKGQWVQVPTPNKNDDRKFLLGFNVTEGYVSDLYLGKTLPFVVFVKDHQGFRTKAEACSYLLRVSAGKISAIHLLSEINKPTKQNQDQEVVGPIELPEIPLPREAVRLSYKNVETHPMIEHGLAYARKRNLTEEDLWLYEVHYCVGGQYGGRLLFPVRDGGKIVSFQTRTIRDDLVNEGLIQKNLNPSMPKVAVYGLENLKVWWERNNIPFEQKRIIVCEGPIDAIRARGVAPLGSSITKPQLEKIISAAPCEVILAMDMDVAGVRGTMKLVDSFSKKVPFRIAIYPTKDVGELGRDQIEQRVIGDAIPWGMGAKALLFRRAMEEERNHV